MFILNKQKGNKNAQIKKLNIMKISNNHKEMVSYDFSNLSWHEYGKSNCYDCDNCNTCDVGPNGTGCNNCNNCDTREHP